MEQRHETRRARLLQLIEKKFSNKQFLLAEAVGVSPNLISRYAVGAKGIGEKMRDKIEAACGMPAGWMDTTEGPPTANVTTPNVVPAPIGSHRIPLIDYVQAGAWTGVQDPFEPGAADEYLLTDLELSGSAFALEIKGESMLPEFRPGDRVIIDPEVMPAPGDFVVAKNGAEEATFKKYRPRSIDAAGNTVFELVPLNEDFPSMRSDVVPIRIVGTMVEHRKYRKKI